MKTLALLACAATAALFPTIASAQGPAPQAGHSWREGAVREMRGGPERVIVRRPHERRRFAHIPRIRQGFIVPQMWWGPQFTIRNWGGYGFPQPFAGGRWIRYYDDALLIDRDGRVRDGRYGYDWDRYEDEWDYDDRGVPVYVGDGDFEPEDRDYAWAERYERHGDRRGGYEGPHRGPVYGHGYPPPSACHARCGGPAYGHGGGYGYAWSGPVVVTETITTTTAPVVETRTYYEYEEAVSTRRPARRHHRVRRAPSRPGERG
jgi:Ni/Co efflux regulator RcnB